MASRSQRGREVGTLSVTQLRLFLGALEAAGAHEPSGCEGPCPAELEHNAVGVLRELIADGERR